MESIIKKYLRGETSEPEERKLYLWLLKNDENLKIFKQEIAFYMHYDSDNDNVNVQKAFEEFEKTVKNRERKRVHIFSHKRYYKYAAALVILVTSVFFIKNIIATRVEKNSTIITDLAIDANLKNKIVLTRNDGSRQVLKREQEELSYLDLRTEKKLTYNELKVPKGQIFRLILSDSTVVWLNADTKLRYPERFISTLTNRTVFLEGEAFFEVSHDKNKPFIVNTNGIDIQVLGTKFNISSYVNDNQINTTLVEGSVKVIDDEDTDNTIIIKPSYQASFLRKNRSLSIKEVNTSDYTAWLQRKIIFHNISFSELIIKIERTYNVEIINENKKIKKEHFTGQFDIENIETIFKALSTSYYFEYEINNNIITIKN